MSTEQNKAVVRRFITEVLSGGNLALMDELLAPNYVNPGMGGIDRAAFRGVLSGLGSAFRGGFAIENVVAEGDAVVVRFTLTATMPSGEKVPARGLTYYSLANGQIVEDDPITTPDLKQLLAPMMGAPAA